MVAKLNRLPATTQKAFQQLACVGSSAEISILAAVLEKSEQETEAALWEALQLELIIRSEDSYRFAHDRVQEAAYSLIAEEARAEAHLRIGRLLHAHTPPEKREEAVGKDYHSDEHVVGYYNAGDRMKYWGKWGAFWGGFWGLLFGAAFFWVPAIGPVLVGGPLAAWIVAGLENAVVVGGLSAIGAGLYSIGIPKDSIVTYETAIKAGEFLVVAHGTSDETAKAKNILSALKPSDLTDHVLEPSTQAATR